MEILETGSVGSGQPWFTSNGMEPANTPPFPIAPPHSPDAPTTVHGANEPLGTPGVTDTNVVDRCDDTVGGTEEVGGSIVGLGTDDETGTGHVDDATVTTGIDDASVVTGATDDMNVAGTDDMNVAGADDTNVAGKDGANIAGAELTNAAAGIDDATGRGFAAADDI